MDNFHRMIEDVSDARRNTELSDNDEASGVGLHILQNEANRHASPMLVSPTSSLYDGLVHFHLRREINISMLGNEEEEEDDPDQSEVPLPRVVVLQGETVDQNMRRQRRHLVESTARYVGRVEPYAPAVRAPAAAFPRAVLAHRGGCARG